MATALERLVEARTAYHDLMTGKISSYSVNGRAVTYHDAARLKEYIDHLQLEVAAASGGATRNRVRFGGRT